MSRIDDFIKKHLGDASHGQQQTKPMHPTQSVQSTGESSVGDLIKKHLGTAYGSEQQTHTAQPSQASGSAVDDFIGKYYTPVDNNYIYSYITDWDTYAKDAKAAYDGLSWESATSGSFDRFNDTEKDLSSRAAAIRSYVEAHKNDYGEEQYKNIISQLDEMATFQSNFRTGLTEAVKMYSQYGSQQEYDNAVAAWEDYNEKSRLDVKAAEQEINDFWADYEAYQNTQGLYWEDYYVSEEEMQAAIDRYMAYFEKYGIDPNAYTNHRERDMALAEAIRDRKDYVAEAKRIQEGNKLASVADPNSELYDPNFQQNAGYVDDGKTPLIPKYKDVIYGYINDDQDDIWGASVGSGVNGSVLGWFGAGVTLKELNRLVAARQMTADEKKLYNYYYNTQGYDVAERYLDNILNTLNARKIQKDTEYLENLSTDHRHLASLLSVGTSIGSAIEYAGDAINYGVGQLTGKNTRLDENTLAQHTNTIRSTVANEVDWMIGNWDVHDFLYNAAMSGADSLVASAFGPAGGVVLGLSAAAQGTNDALARGMSDGQAFWNGLFSGAFEGIFETVSIGQFNSLKEIAPQGIKDIFKNLGKTMLVNASEEALTEIANIAYDTLVNGEFANYTLEELKNGAWKNALQQVVESGASGALVGFGMGTVGNARGYYSNKNTQTKQNTAPNITQTPQSAHTAENLSGITQDGNAAIPGTAGQETAANTEENMQQDAGLETNAVTKPLNTYPAEKQKTIRSYLQSVDEQLKSFVKRVKSGDLRSERKKISDVSTRAAADIKSLLGFDVSGYTHNINASDIKHILNRHGENGEHDTTMSVDDDIARIGWVLENYDRVEPLTKNGEQVHSKLYRDKNHSPAPQVRFIKKIDGTYYVVEAVCENKHQKFWVQSAYLQKNEDVTQASAEGQTTNHKTYAQSEVASPSSSNIISPAEPVVNPDIASPENSSTSVGAAPAGFDPLTHAMVQYGNIPEGENAVRDDSLPVSMDGESKVSRVARTALGAEATPDAYAEDIRKEVADGNLSYIPITNDATVQKAEKHIQELGWQEAYTEWVANVEKGITGAEMTATGSLLLNNAANAGDHKSWRNILYHFQKLGTNTAQGLQAFRILKTLSPSDKLWMIEKSAKQMVKDLGLDVEITLDEALVEEYDNAQTDEQREAAEDKIVKSVAEQIPPTVMEKVNSWRYLNMLGNLRTQIRNLTGNVSMAGVTSVKNTVATALEYLVHKISGGKIERTKSFTVSREMMQAGLQDFGNVESIVNSGGRYALRDGESTDIAQRIQDARTIFKFKPMEGYRKLINWAMDKGDVLFSKPAYARALAGYLKAHGVTDADFSKVDPELMDKARLYAVKQAQEQTFRDTNRISKFVSKIGRHSTTHPAAEIFMEGLLPFRKTPANIAARAWEYSPLGIINAVADSVNAARNASYAKSDTKANGKKKVKPKADTTAADAINSWAKTLTGGGLIGLGMLLQSLGLIRGTEDDDEQRAFDSLNGWQEYSLALPGGTNLTIDALSPAALPLLVGAQMKAVIDGEGFSLDQVLGALSALADPMVDMSLMSGIKSLLEEIRYSKEPWGQIAVNALIDYATQIVTNSLVGQLERGTEQQRMQTYVDPDSSTFDWLQKALGGISAKTPGWDYQQIPYINAWGEKEETPAGLNLLENTVSPFYFDKGEKTPLTEELNRLYNDAQETGVYPSRPERKQTYTDKNGVKHRDYGLDAQEYVDFATVQGQTQKRILDEMISSDAYKSLPDAYKAEAVKKAYYYARETARKQVLSDTAAFAESKWMSEISGSEAETILSRVHLRYLTDQVIPEAGHQSARQVQIVEQIAADDGYTEDEQEAMLLATLTEAKAKAYDKVKGMGYDIDDFAAVYRIYQKADDSKTYNKEHAIRDIMRKLNVSESTATALYEAY